MQNKDLITYSYFGIDPASFYAGKFAGWPNAPDYLATPKNRFDIEYDRARFLVSNSGAVIKSPMHHHVTRVPATAMIEAVDHESFFIQVNKCFPNTHSRTKD